MTRAIISKIGKTAQVALASAVIAGGLLAASPLVASAHNGWACPDFDGDGRVTTSDILYAVDKYRTHDPQADVDGDGLVTVLEILEVVEHQRESCEAS